MSELHGDRESPDQARIECENCGKKISDYLRQHSYLKEEHLKESDLERWDSDRDYYQCNGCGHIRTFD